MKFLQHRWSFLWRTVSPEPCFKSPLTIRQDGICIEARTLIFPLSCSPLLVEGFSVSWCHVCVLHFQSSTQSLSSLLHTNRLTSGFYLTRWLTCFFFFLYIRLTVFLLCSESTAAHSCVTSASQKIIHPHNLINRRFHLKTHTLLCSFRLICFDIYTR